jgi:DNA-directed RNA polymerase specialized sigma subunit
MKKGRRKLRKISTKYMDTTILGISEQAVFQAERRALDKLYKYLLGSE